MRIISQNKGLDASYEMVVLRIVRANKEYCVHACTQDIDYEIAFYSTEEKAVKAMEMCREYYDSIFFEPQSEIFQFPAEEEVE